MTNTKKVQKHHNKKLDRKSNVWYLDNWLKRCSFILTITKVQNQHNKKDYKAATS